MGAAVDGRRCRRRLARLLEEYEVDEDVLRTDLENFIERLTAKGLLRGEPSSE